MQTHALFIVACLAVSTVGVTRAAEPSAEVPITAEIRAAITRALPLIRQGGAGHMAERKCFACHSQTMPVMAFVAAKRLGLADDSEQVAEHADFIHRSLEQGRERYVSGKGQGGNVITAGYALWTLDLAGREADDLTDVVTEYLLTAHGEDRAWRVTTIRPPAEGSHFAATFVALRALRRYARPEQQERFDARVAAVRTWLESTESKDTEDRVFRLRALAEVDASDDLVRSAADELIAAQRNDGGWAQLDDAESDPYATATALTALRDAGELSTDDAIYRRGLRFLLDTQRADGSWHVKSRSKPFQTYYESGYPHAGDQFISIAAAGWAVAALAEACPPEKAGERDSPTEQKE